MMWLFFEVKFKFTQTKHRKKIGIRGLKIFFNKILLIKIFTSLYTIIKHYFIKGISIYLKITKSKFRLYLLQYIILVYFILYLYIVLKIQLGCTYGSTFIYFDVSDLKCLITSLTRSNSFKLIMDLYCNPSLGLTIKAKPCKGAGQKGISGVISHAPRSVRECEGMNPHIPK